MRNFILRLLAPKICQIGDVILTRSGRAYWVQPGQLVEMRIVRWPQFKQENE